MNNDQRGQLITDYLSKVAEHDYSTATDLTAVLSRRYGLSFAVTSILNTLQRQGKLKICAITSDGLPVYRIAN